MNSSRDSKRRTEAEVQAIMRAHIIDGHIVSDVWRMAQAGELGVPAFDPGRRYIYSLIKNNRDQFEASNPDALAASTTKALAMAHKANLDALRNLGADTDPAERARVAKAVADSARTLTAVAGKTKPTTTRDEPTSEAANETPKQDATLANLLGAARKTTTKVKTTREPENAKQDQVRSGNPGSLSHARNA